MKSPQNNSGGYKFLTAETPTTYCPDNTHSNDNEMNDSSSTPPIACERYNMVITHPFDTNTTSCGDVSHKSSNTTTKINNSILHQVPEYMHDGFPHTWQSVRHIFQTHLMTSLTTTEYENVNINFELIRGQPFHVTCKCNECRTNHNNNHTIDGINSSGSGSGSSSSSSSGSTNTENKHGGNDKNMSCHVVLTGNVNSDAINTMNVGGILDPFINTTKNSCTDKGCQSPIRFNESITFDVMVQRHNQTQYKPERQSTDTTCTNKYTSSKNTERDIVIATLKVLYSLHCGESRIDVHKQLVWNPLTTVWEFAIDVSFWYNTSPSKGFLASLMSNALVPTFAPAIVKHVAKNKSFKLRFDNNHMMWKDVVDLLGELTVILAIYMF